MADRESEFCKECPIFRTCHPNLRPVKLERKGMAMVDVSLDPEEDDFLDCRNYTCDQDGRDALDGTYRQIVSGKIRVRDYGAVDYNGNPKTVEAAPFRTKYKPTAKTRIVDTDGYVYSEQGGVYYPTSQRANTSRHGRNK